MILNKNGAYVLDQKKVREQAKNKTKGNDAKKKDDDVAKALIGALTAVLPKSTQEETQTPSQPPVVPTPATTYDAAAIRAALARFTS